MHPGCQEQTYGQYKNVCEWNLFIVAARLHVKFVKYKLFVSTGRTIVNLLSAIICGGFTAVWGLDVAFAGFNPMQEPVNCLFVSHLLFA